MYLVTFLFLYAFPAPGTVWRLRPVLAYPCAFPPPRRLTHARGRRVRMPKLKAGWWSPEEEQSLLDGHAKHTAAGSLSLWADILGDTSLFFAIGRTNIDLKDKWRTLRKRVVPSAADPQRLELQAVRGEAKHGKSRDRVKPIFAPPAPSVVLPHNHARDDMRAPPKKRAKALSTPQELPSECSKCSAPSGSEIAGSCTSYCPRAATRCLVEVCAWCRLCAGCRGQPCVRLEQCDHCLRHICASCNVDPSARPVP